MHVQSKVLGRVDGEAWVPDKSLNQGLDNRAESAYRIPTPPHESGCSGGTWLPVWARDCHVGGRQWPRTLQFDSQRPHVSQSRASCLKHATRRRPEEMAEQCASTDGQTDKQRHTHTHTSLRLPCCAHSIAVAMKLLEVTCLSSPVLQARLPDHAALRWANGALSQITSDCISSIFQCTCRDAQLG